MILAGTFRMGCLTRRGCGSREKPVREVRVASFALAKHVRRFEVAVADGPFVEQGTEGQSELVPLLLDRTRK